MTADEVLLLSGEVYLTRAQKLWRQIPKHLLDEDTSQIATHAFGPSTADRKKPSYSQQSHVSAQESFEWHNNHAPSKSEFVAQLCVTDSLEIELPVISDAGAPDPGNRAPGHAYIDFRSLKEKAEERTKRKLLWDAARKHGIAYVPPAAAAVTQEPESVLFD